MGSILAGVGPLILIANNVFYLNMGVYRKGVLISDRLIIFQYWYKQLLVQDLVSVFPLCIYIYINLGETNDKVESNISIMKYSLLLLLFKFERIMNIIQKTQERYIERVKMSNIIGLFKLLGFALLMCHLFAILFLSVGIEELNNGKHCWLTDQNIQEEQWHVQYIYSYYFAAVTMMTIGYGDITPITTYEMILDIFLMLASSGIFGFTLNSINQIFESFFKQENMKQQKLILLNNYMKKKNVSVDLQYQIREYLDYVWQECTEDVEDQKLLESQLSETLKEKLSLEANRLVLKDSPIFKNNFSEQVILKTVVLIKEVKCSPEEIIYLKDDIDDSSIYFIDKGSADIFIDLKQKGGKSKGCQNVKTIKQGQCFGVVNFFTGQPRNYNIRSSEFTSLLLIKRNDFLNLLSEYPDDYERFCCIKDDIILNKRMKIDEQLYCNQCQIIPKHQFQECPYQHYVPNKILTIKKNNFSVNQERSDYSDRSFSKYQTLLSQFNVIESLKKFFQAYEQQITQYEIQYQLDFDNELTEESDSDYENNKNNNNQDNIQTPRDNMPSVKQDIVKNIIEITPQEEQQLTNTTQNSFNINNNKKIDQQVCLNYSNSLNKYCKNTTTSAQMNNQQNEITEELNCFESNNQNQDFDIFQLDFEQDKYPIILIHTYEDWEKQQDQLLKEDTLFTNNLNAQNSEDQNKNNTEINIKNLQTIASYGNDLYQIQENDEYPEKQSELEYNINSNNKRQSIQPGNDNSPNNNDQKIKINFNRNIKRQQSQKIDQQQNDHPKQIFKRPSYIKQTTKNIDSPTQKIPDQKSQLAHQKSYQRNSSFMNNPINALKRKSSFINIQQPVQVQQIQSQAPQSTYNHSQPILNQQILLQQIKTLESQIVLQKNSEFTNQLKPEFIEFNNDQNKFSIFSQNDFELLNFEIMKNFSIYFPHNNLINVLLQIKILSNKITNKKLEKNRKNKNFANKIRQKTTLIGSKLQSMSKLEQLFKRKKNNNESNIDRISSIEEECAKKSLKSQKSQSDNEDIDKNK